MGQLLSLVDNSDATWSVASWRQARPNRARIGREMGLILNVIAQIVVWYGIMGVVIFSAAGTPAYSGGWLYLGIMIALSLAFGIYGARVDPGLLRERLKPPLQKDQPLADKLIVIPILLLVFGGIAFMAADAARWRFSRVPPAGQWFGCTLLLVVMLFLYWTVHTNSFAAPVVKIQKERGQTVVTTGPYAIVRHPLYFGTLFFMVATSLILGSWWGLATVPLLALGFAIRIPIEERTLREGLQGYDDYVRRVRWRLIPLIW